MARFKTPDVCPVCGEDVPPGAKACPECGACEKTGWKEDADSTGLAEEEEFDYDEYLENEFGGKTPSSHRLKYHWIATAIVVLLALFWWVWTWAL
jgi:hypothetical protein